MLLAFSQHSFSYNIPKRDSLFSSLNKAKSDTARINCYIAIGRFYLYELGDMDTIKKYASIILKLSNEANYDLGKAHGYNFYGIYYKNHGEPYEAMKYYKLSLNRSVLIKKEDIMASGYVNIGALYNDLGNYSEALNYSLKGLEINKRIKNKRGLSIVHINLGNIYSNLGDFSQASQNYFSSLSIKEELKDSFGISITLNNIGILYDNKGDRNTALSYYFESVYIKKLIGDKAGIGLTYHNIGNIFLQENKFKQALDYHNKSLKIKEEIGDKYGILMSYCTLAEISIGQNKFEEAFSYLSKAEQIAKEIGAVKEESRVYNIYGRAYERKKQINKAIENYEKALIICKKIGYKEGIAFNANYLSEAYRSVKDYEHAMQYSDLSWKTKDSILNSNNIAKLTELDSKYQSEKKEEEIKILTIDKQLKDKTIKEQQVVRYALLIGILLILIIVGVLINRNRVKQKLNNKLEKQKNEIESKNILITDSINYAKTIQDTILPDESMFKDNFNEHFVFFKPKDIVSGDFYWLSKYQNKVICAVADCTGHGVPGAFMSLLGYNMLEQSINEGKGEPGKILNALNNIVLNTMEKDRSVNFVKTGMDISIVSFDRETMMLEYAGAHNSLYYVSENKLNEIKAENFSIGCLIEGKPPLFMNHKLNVKSGDMIYLISDGYPDQIGGLKRKKFFYKPFRDLLESISTKKANEQFEKLDEIFNDWKGSYPQTDDVLIIGIRL